jgi:hypothetical protein
MPGAPPPPDNLSFRGWYSLVTGGETNTGDFSYTLTYFRLPGHSQYALFTTFSDLGYPISITLDGLGGILYAGFFYAPIVADIIATNGFHMQLEPGAGFVESMPVDGWRWRSDPVTAFLAVTNPPSITSQPEGRIVRAHTNAQFVVNALGIAPLNYQWAFEGTNISGATIDTLKITNVVPSALGDYSVTVTNLFGAVTSSNANLAMYPFIATPYTGLVADWGKDAVMSIVAWGTGPLGYQWFKDGVPIAGAIDSDLNLISVQFADAGLYSVVVTSPFGSATNAPAELVVTPAGIGLGLYPGVTISGVVGYHYIIQSTTNLQDTNSWVTRTNITLTVPVQLWLDTDANASLPSNPHRFYKILPGF